MHTQVHEKQVDENKTLTIVWLALAAVTLVSWWLGSSRGEDAFVSDVAVTFGVILLAAVKVRVIVSYFMEVRHAPIRLKNWMDGWLAFTVLTLLAIYAFELSMPPV